MAKIPVFCHHICVFLTIYETFLAQHRMIACSVVYYQTLNTECSDDGKFFWIHVYMHGNLAILNLMIGADIMLIHCSKKGTIMDTRARHRLPIFLYLRYIQLLKIQCEKTTFESTKILVSNVPITFMLGAHIQDLY